MFADRALRTGGIRTVFRGIPLAVLVAVHVGRVLGGRLGRGGAR